VDRPVAVGAIQEQQDRIEAGLGIDAMASQQGVADDCLPAVERVDITTNDNQTDSDIYDGVDRLDSLVEQQQETIQAQRDRIAELEADESDAGVPDGDGADGNGRSGPTARRRPATPTTTARTRRLAYSQRA
jgi:hypothetical protein